MVSSILNTPLQAEDEPGCVQVKSPARRRLDTLTSIISDIDISDDEEEYEVGPLDTTALIVSYWTLLDLGSILVSIMHAGAVHVVHLCRQS